LISKQTPCRIAGLSSDPSGALDVAREETEDLIRDRCFQELFYRLGQPDTLSGTGKTARFELREPHGPGDCRVEGRLSYTLPSGEKIFHTNDILLSRGSSQFFAVECKFLSAVSDQFKARAYDMLQMKRTLGEQVIGIMVYAHVPGCGIGLQTAKAYCHPFDHFVGFELRRPEDFETLSWQCLPDLIEAAILKARNASN
jgi:hypothetical protein